MSKRIFVSKIDCEGGRKKCVEAYDDVESFMKAYDSMMLIRLLIEPETYNRKVEKENGEIYTVKELKELFNVDKSRKILGRIAQESACPAL